MSRSREICIVDLFFVAELFLRFVFFFLIIRTFYFSAFFPTTKYRSISFLVYISVESSEIKQIFCVKSRWRRSRKHRKKHSLCAPKELNYIYSSYIYLLSIRISTTIIPETLEDRVASQNDRGNATAGRGCRAER